MKAINSEIDAFTRDGYLVLPGMFSTDEIIEMQNECDHLFEFLVNASIANNRTSGRLNIRRSDDGALTLRKIQPVNDLSKIFSKLSNDARIQKILITLFGDTPELMEEKLNYKQQFPANVTGLDVDDGDDSFFVHNDWAYHKAQGYPPKIINAAICIDDCPSAAGPLRVWPGTHTSHIEHEPIRRSFVILPELLAGRESVELAAGRGTLLIFHGLLAHCSAPNRSDKPRRMIFFSYCPKSELPAPDARNGPTRQTETAYESRYQSLKAKGEFRDKFGLKR